MARTRTTGEFDDVAHGPAATRRRNHSRTCTSPWTVAHRAWAIVVSLSAGCFSEADNADDEGGDEGETTASASLTGEPSTGVSSSVDGTASSDDGSGSSEGATGPSDGSGSGSSGGSDTGADSGSTGGEGACAAMGDAHCGDQISVPGEQCWGPAQPENAGGDPLGRAAIADFDDDGHADIATIDGDDGVWVYPGSSTGLDPATVLTESAGTGMWSIDAGDLNADGLADLAIGGFDPQVWIFYGNGAGALATTTEPIDVGLGAETVRIVDLQGDGAPELLVAGEFDDASDGAWVTVLEDQDGAWVGGAADFQIPGTASVVDMRPLVDPDLAAPGLVVILADGTLSFAPPDDTFVPDFSTVTTVTPGAYRLELGDLDDDGVPDVALAGRGTVTAVVYDTFAQTLAVGSVLGTTNLRDMGVAIGDVDRDGDADLVVSDVGFQRIQVYPQQNGKIGAPTPIVLSEAPQGVALAHVVGDCLFDIVALGTSTVVLVPADP